VKIERRQVADWLTVVAASGELDAYTGPELQEALADSLGGEEQQKALWLLVDLSNVQYLDSIGLGILVQAAKRSSQGGGAMAIACATPVVLKVFDISGTREMLNVRESVEEASELLAARREAGTNDVSSA
jgi:anti-sigma B factor antagonist